ncbi:MAG: hypothetical protein R2764_23750, partial [Bacteroidales bacterium]
MQAFSELPPSSGKPDFGGRSPPSSGKPDFGGRSPSSFGKPNFGGGLAGGPDLFYFFDKVLKVKVIFIHKP